MPGAVSSSPPPSSPVCWPAACWSGTRPTALFAASSLAPGDDDFECIDVSYTGNAATKITLAANSSADDTSSPLAQHVGFTVERIDPNTTCSLGAASLETLSTASETLQGFVTRTTGTPVGTWTPSAPERRRYRFHYGLRNNTAAAGRTAEVDLTWTSQSTVGGS